LESSSYTTPDSSLTNDLHPYLYGSYEYEIQNDNLTENAHLADYFLTSPRFEAIILFCLLSVTLFFVLHSYKKK
jgi:hypothetical protein